MSVAPLPHDENAELRAENASLRNALTASMYAKALERFHLLDGLKDGFCPACGAAVDIVDNGHGTGVRIRSRW